MELSQPLKKMLTSFLCKQNQQTTKVDKNTFIIYKIVDSVVVNGEEHFKIQCINTKAIMSLTIEELVFDFSILHGLHPIQGCFLGIEYAKTLKRNPTQTREQQKSLSMFSKYPTCRYGDNRLLYQDRSGLLGFESLSSGELFVMDPRDIALSREIIEEFDVIQAFCIGGLAGLKLSNPMIKEKSISETKPYLKLVKG